MVKATLEREEEDYKTYESRRGKLPQVQGGGGNKPSGGVDKEKEAQNSKIADCIVSEKPNVKWADVAGLENAKKSLHEAVVLPVQFPNFFNDVVKPWRGILMYGPPGTGKTFLAKACAGECDSTFFSVSSADLISKYVGESERTIKQLFETARGEKSAIIFIDEIDSLCGAREEGENESQKRVKNEFLVQMGGCGNDKGRVLVLGATNLPWAIDQAMRRRFEKRVLITLPEPESRAYLLKRKMKDTPHTLQESDWSELAGLTNNYSGADLEILCKDAAMEPLRKAQVATKFEDMGNGKFRPLMDNEQPSQMGHQVVQNTLYLLPNNGLMLDDISFLDFKSSLKRTKPSVNMQDLEQYNKWTTEFGEEGS